MTTIQKIRVMLAEDHQIMRQGLRNVLEHYPEFEVIGEASDGRETLSMAKALTPDVLLCDIRLPVFNGIGCVRLMKKVSPQTKILILSAYDDDEYVLETMRAGAFGYLLKTVASSELADAIKKVHAGEVVLHPDIAAKAWRLRAEAAVPESKLSELSVREIEILSLAGQELSNRELAARLGLSVRTVEKHFDNIFRKLGVPSRREAVRYAAREHLINVKPLGI